MPVQRSEVISRKYRHKDLSEIKIFFTVHSNDMFTDLFSRPTADCLAYTALQLREADCINSTIKARNN
jgi:hypothetical protein